MTTEASDRQRNDDKIKRGSAGLSLRTRTLSSTTVPLPSLHQSTVSTPISVQSKCSSVVRSPRPRGRPPKNRNILDNSKTLQPSFNKQSEEKKDCNLTLTITREESAASSLERLQQQQKLLSLCNGVDNYDDEQDSNNTNATSTGVTDSMLLPKIAKSQGYTNIDHACKKRSSSRKRKQSNIEELIVKKRILISNHSKGSLALAKNVTEKSSLPGKSKVLDDNIVNYGFLADYDIVEPYRQRTDIRLLPTCPLICFGSTYWPTSWEYSAAALTGHVQKKASKDVLRKIRLLCDMGITNKTVSSVSPLKTNLTLKKYKSVVQRRGSANKLTASSSFDIPSGSRQSSSTVVKRPPGRPPGKKNKLLQAVIKGNSPRKSPRQHASTLAAIMSNKTGNDKSVTEQHDKLLEADLEFNKNSIDMDGPCVLTMAVPKYEHHSGVRHRRHHKQLNHQHNIIKRRCQRRSITPPPPKLCAQQLPPQRSHTNTTSVDQEVIKLRTKHVDVVRRRARDERLRAAFVCQQLHKIQEVAEQNRRDLVQEFDDEDDLDYKLLSNAIVLSSVCNQEQICPFQTIENDQEPDNMCLQIMYEQTTDKRFLCANLTDETLQMYYKQRDIALAERQANSNIGDTLSYDLGSDIVSAASKRKKKRPNMTGWPKEKRRKVISTISSSMITSEEALNGDSDVEKNKAIKQRRALAAEKQKLRRRRLKLQQQLSKEKSKVKVVTAAIRRRPGRPCGSSNKNKIAKYRTINVGKDMTANNHSNSNTTTVQQNKFKVKKQQKKCLPVHKKTTAVSIGKTTSDPQNRIVKRSCGRPKGSIGPKKRLKLQLLEQLRQNQTSLPEQQKENVAQQQTSTGKLKCVISTRKKRMTLLSTSSSPSSTLSQKKLMTGNRTKKKSNTVQSNLSSTCLASLSLPVTGGKITRTTKRRRLQQQQQQQQMSTTSVTWDVGRPKRYHSTSHGKNSSNVDEDYCFVGSQPFEQHCPGVGGGLSQNTVLDNQQYNQKENSLNPNL